MGQTTTDVKEMMMMKIMVKENKKSWRQWSRNVEED